MHIHRSPHTGHFTVLPNEMLQRADLSLPARGLLGYLLSRPDGWRESAEELAKRFRASLGSVRRALRELTAAGYYQVVKTRLPNGRIISEQHLHDVPRTTGPAPDDESPAAGAPEPGAPAPSKTKKQEKGTTPLPTLRPKRPRPRPPVDDRTRDAAALLLRVVRPEPRLRIGQAEAERLAPVVARWLDHGSTPGDLAAALLPGLPATVHSPAGLLHRRLHDKLPPAPAAPIPPLPTCDDCRNPVPRPGLCTPCANRPPHPADPRPGHLRAREALQAARAALRHRASA